MSLFGRLFGKKSDSPAPVPPAQAPVSVSRAATSDPSKDPNMIRVFDSYGREMFITKQVWRESILLPHIQKEWSDPNGLYATIVQALNDGFGADMIKPAERLAEIDPDRERGAVVLAIAYREQKRVSDAETVLRKHIAQHGESGVVLTNLAKVQSDQGNPELALRTLWHGLELDPNQENGLGWYEAIHRQKDGEEAGLTALRRIAALPCAWRARLWLARDALKRRDLPGALALYEEAFALAPRPVPTDMLQQVSGDLGNQGHLPEILQLAAPHFDIAVHGLAVGNNLIKANFDLGRIDAARALLDQHYAQKRPDWKESLAFWDTELTKARVAITQPEPTEHPSISLLAMDDPVWLSEASPAKELFPAPIGELPRIAFLGSTTTSPTIGSKPAHQMSDTPGRLSRAIPLFLAEQVRFRSQAAVRTIVPWVGGNTPAFVLSGVPWETDAAAHQARAAETPCDYVVVTHLVATGATWQVDLRLIRTIDAQWLASATAAFAPASPQDGLLELANQLLALLAQQAEVPRADAPAYYQVPANAEFPYYLLRLEQLLAVRCYANTAANSTGLSGEREILDGNLQLCLNHPLNVTTRLILFQTLASMKRIRPQVVEEFRERVLLLQKEKPLSEPAHGVVQRLANEVFPT